MEIKIEDDRLGKVELDVEANGYEEDCFITGAYLIDLDRDATDDELEYLNETHADVAQAMFYESKIMGSDFM